MKIVLSFDVPDEKYVDHDRLLFKLRRAASDALIDEKNEILAEISKNERLTLVKEYDCSIESIIVRRWTCG